MKRLISLLGFLFYCSHLAFAKPVDAKRAKAFAKQFIQIDEEDLRATNSNFNQQAKAYYIFNAKADKGFVIVSGEDRLPLLVGYADQGHIDQKHFPPQLKALLKHYEARVQTVRQTNEESLRAKKPFIHKPKAIVRPLVKALWGQEKPFNDLAPEMHDGVRAVAGCVATATAQIMYYHKWPKKGRGSFSYYPQVYGKELSVDFSKSSYEWSKMMDIYPIKYSQDFNGVIKVEPRYTAEAGKAVAKLMYDLGVSVSMEFNTNARGGSSSSTFIMAQSLNKYFDYTARNFNRDHTSYDHFIKIIKRELKAKHPLMLSGGSRNSGHAWVVDGFDENDYLHCNWGWTGIANGFYSLDFMVPAQIGVGAGLGRYNENQSIIILQPNKKGVQKTISPILKLAILQDGKIAYTGRRGQYVSNHLNFSMSKFGNFDVKDFKGSIALGIYKPNGEFIETQGAYHQVLLGSSKYYKQVETSIYLGNYASAKYLIRLLCKQEGSKDWQMMEGSNTLKVEIKNGRFYVIEDNSDLKLRLAEAPKEVAPSYTNSVGASSLVIENLSNQIIEPNIGLKLINKESGQVHRMKLEQIKLHRFETKRFQISYDLSRLPSLEAGDYDLSFEVYAIEAGQEVAKAIENTFGSYPVRVLDRAKNPMLRCKELSIKQGSEPWESDHITPEVLKGSVMILQPILQNIGAKDFNGTLTYRLKNLSDGSFTDLETTEAVRLNVREESAPRDFTLVLDLSKLDLRDGAYELHLQANENGKSVDVWSPRLKRYTFLWEINQTVGLNLAPEEAKLEVYPNPVQRDLHIRGAYQELAIYSLQGERLMFIKDNANKRVETLDLSQLSQGIYILRLRGAKAWETFRIYKR